MRVSDRALPTFAPADSTESILTWPAHVHLVLEGPTTPPYTWDSGHTWDDGSVWDPRWLSSGNTDTICDLAGVDAVHGGQDNVGLFPAGNLKATLIDPDGRYSRLNPDGTLTDYQIGRYISVVVELDGEWFWIYSGRLTRWDGQVNGAVTTISLEAFNSPAELVQVGTFTAGVAGERPGPRMRAILAATGNATLADGARFDDGTVALTAQASQRSPWEEMQVVSLSDGGWLFPDSDDALMYIDRGWVYGRGDQPATLVFTDNVCDDDEAIMVWNPVLSANDDALARAVFLTNVAEMWVSVGVPDNGRFPVLPTLTHSQPDQWTTQTEGEALAVFLLSQRYQAEIKASFQLYLHAPNRDLWQDGIDLRIGDHIRFRHHVPQPGGAGFTIDVGLIVNSLAHSISPAGWVVTVGTSTVVDHREAIFDATWDVAEWDVDYWDGTPP